MLGINRAYAGLLRPRLKTFPCVACSACGGRDLRSLRDFVAEHKARLGVVVNNDVMVRQYEENVIGLPFTSL